MPRLAKMTRIGPGAGIIGKPRIDPKSHIKQCERAKYTTETETERFDQANDEPPGPTCIHLPHFAAQNCLLCTTKYLSAQVLEGAAERRGLDYALPAFPLS
jgi:hypothetical protein